MASPRIIAGKAKGMRLFPVPGDSTRPITDRVKENLFNIIGVDIIDTAFLDLFGGTGSVGLEAISRGAAYCRFIEKNPNAAKTLRKNIVYTKLEGSSELINTDALPYLKQTPDRSFDMIYVAPPQYKQMWKTTLNLLDQHPAWLAPYAWIIVQIHPVEFEEDLAFTNFHEFDRRKYGSTILIFYEANQ
ncbi:MAG TPA: 16S rRNA (guanine(966)-N(2))-methyltransferase RsmD [Chloroflexi bacterium]|nr:16S rRNA (guanine(966)-N(2))-methyltransferase RsmD [Chloroflexota bacterium]